MAQEDTQPGEDPVEQTWILDSGASSHMTMERAAFHSYVELRKPTNVTIGDGTTLRAEGIGSVFLQLKQQHGGQVVKLKNTLYVSGISHNLLSVNRVVRGGSTITFAASKCSITKAGAIITALDKKGVWILEGRVAHPTNVERVALLTMQETHERLGHVGEDCIKRMAKNGSTDGLPLEAATEHVSCRACLVTKSTTTPNRKQAPKDRYERIGVLYSDICQ